MKDTHITRHGNSTLVTFNSQGKPLEWDSLGDQVMML